MSRRRDDVAAGLLRADAATERAAPAWSAAQTLQRTLGNARLLQLQASLRAASVQRQADSEAAHVRVSGAGDALPAAVQARAESALGEPMSDVRVVADTAACADVGAHAFATHDNARPLVVLGAGVDPSSPAGEFTLMHELAHIAQQRRGETDELDGLGGDPGVRQRLEDEADRAATTALTKGGR